MRDFYTKENMQEEAFHVRDAGLSFAPEQLSFEMETGTGREGTIRVRHRAGKPVRGYVYPSERCMRGVREQFAPAADKSGWIRWQFDARGIAPGRTVRGFFRVISPYGEYRIPYTVQITGKGQLLRVKDAHGASSQDTPGWNAAKESGNGQDRIRNKEEFAALAQRDFAGAVRFFYSSRFEEILESQTDRTLYRGLSVRAQNAQNVEEFLAAACNMEKTVYLPVEKSLSLRIPGKAGRASGRMAGSRAERALEAHRMRVRNSGMGGQAVRTNAPSQEGPQEDLVYIPLHIRREGSGFSGVEIRTEGSFLPASPFMVSASEMADRKMTSDGQNGQGQRAGAQTVSGEASGAQTGPEESSGGQDFPGEAPGGQDVFTVRIPVSRAALHAGKNYGRVLVRGPFNETEVPVEVHCTSDAVPLRMRQDREVRLLQLQLMRLYVDHCLLDKTPEELFRQADRLIDAISMKSHRDLVPRLYGVHLLVLRRQEAEAERELLRIAAKFGGESAAKNFSTRFTGEHEGAYCYRQYLFARCRLEDVQLRSRTVRFLKGIYRQTGDWRTAWMLMDLAEEYAPGTGARWNFLRHQFENGCSSPVIFLEAWNMVKEDPQLLLPGSSVQERWARDDFGLHVLWYAARNNVLSEKAAAVMAALAERKKTFSPLLYKGLCAALTCGTEGTPGENDPQMEKELLRAICIQLVRGQDLSPRAHKWYSKAHEAGVMLTKLEENRLRSTPADDASYRLPAGTNAILRTTAARAERAVLLYDRFRAEQVFPIRHGIAFLRVHGDANTVFLEDAAGNRYAKSLPYALDVQEVESGEGPGQNPFAMAEKIGLGSRGRTTLLPGEEAAEIAGRLLDSGLMTARSHTELVLLSLSGSDGQEAVPEERVRFFLKKADPSRCSPGQRAELLSYLAEAGEYQEALRWLTVYGTEEAGADLLGKIFLGTEKDASLQAAAMPVAWEAFLRGCRQEGLLGSLAASFTGLSEELCMLRTACADAGLSTAELDKRLLRQVLYTGAVLKEHAGIIVSAGKTPGEECLNAAAQYADYAFSNGLQMGIPMTELTARLITQEPDRTADICRICFLKELSMRHGEISELERSAAKAGLCALLSREIIFPFYRQFPGFDDRLDLYAEETLIQYHPSEPDDGSGRKVVFHYANSRRGETGSYRARPMKEMYRDFFVSGFLLFYGEQMHYYITDDAEEKHVVQSGMIGQDARILENCSGRFGLINETTRAAALREYDKALELLTGYYRRSYLESELFRR